MRVAYADTPYIGQAKKHYKADPRCAEVDHAALVRELHRGFDAWAFSLKNSLEDFAWLMPLVYTVQPKARMGAWFKPFCSFKPGVPIAYAWEPVIFWSSRARTREQDTVRDWVEAEVEESPAVRANITLKKGLAGVKPQKFSFWLFEALNMESDDEFVDMFPGSGAVTAAWESWKASKGGAAHQTPFSLSPVVELREEA